MTSVLKTVILTPEEKKAVLKDVKDSRCLGRSDRQISLLTYLLNYETLNKSVPITQYAIALDVLGRPDSFDPAVDSIVRVEMHRLRSSLKQYNQSNSNYILSIPSASYEVVVTPRAHGLRGLWTEKRKIIIAASALAFSVIGLGFISIKAPETKPAVLCSRLVPNLSITHDGASKEAHEYVDSVLRSAFSQQSAFNTLPKPQTCEANAAPSFDIQMTILDREGQFSLALNVVDKEDFSIIESYNLTSKTANINAETPLFYKLTEIANTITLPSGNLARKAYDGSWGSAQRQKNYGCMIVMYDSYAGEVDSELENVQTCLEDAINSGEASLDHYGALATNYLYQARNKNDDTVDDPLAAAERILEQFGDEWPESGEMAIAMMYHEQFRSDFNTERMDRVLGAMQARYDLNPIILIGVAMFKGYSLGQWEEAKKISDYVKKIYSVREQSMFAADAGYALMSGSAAKSFDECYKHYAETSTATNLLVNGCARLDKNKLWLDITEKNLSARGINTVEARMIELKKFTRDPALIAKYEAILTNAEL